MNAKKSCGTEPICEVKAMSDNMNIITMQDEVVEALNRHSLPLVVKKIVLENVLLRVEAAMRDVMERESTETTAAEGAAPETEAGGEA